MLLRPTQDTCAKPPSFQGEGTEGVARGIGWRCSVPRRSGPSGGSRPGMFAENAAPLSGTPWSSVPGRERMAGTARIPTRSRGTGNRQLSEVESYLDVHLAAEQPGDGNLRDFRAFLRALTVPPKGTEGVPVTALPGCCSSGRTSSPSSASSAA